MMGMMFAIYAVPTVLGIAFVAWAVLTRRFSDRTRRVSMVATILLACGVWTLARTDGISSGGAQLAWRWTPTPEQRLLAQANDEPKAPPAPAPEAASVKELPASTPADPRIADAASPKAAKTVEAAPAAMTPPADPVAATAPEWPGFRGPRRDSIVRGVRINADWASAAPVKMWQRPIGPGWSSFAVHGDLLYTQEQRGEDETVTCYRVSTGEPVWRHRDPVRFWESNAGAGPRATPTLSNGRVYAFGATGILNALDARTGVVVWSRNVATDLSRGVPDWGFASSPLVIDDLVIVAASGSLTAYDLATGKPRWVAPRQLGSYSSPHRVTIDGVTQILLLSGTGVVSVAPANGTLLWDHQWAGGTTIIQPAVTDDGDILINSLAMTGGAGTRRLAVTHAADKWTVEERWTSNGLKPYFNDFVVHEGHAFGFDGNILSCIDLADGKRKWKGGRYGNGQLVLLPDQDLLLVLSEDGELALVSATPDQYKELARLPGIEGKTWNHPAVVGNVLLIRNGEQMAAFRLAPEPSVTR
jgi:outer membrane protein assembly factor BamB